MKYVTRLLLALAALAAVPVAQAGCWTPLPAASKISFDIDQAGAPMQGTFADYSGLICIDSGKPSTDRIEVQINMASVDTQLPELNKALRGPDFFDVANWPDAKFVSDSVRKTGTDEYEVSGKLTLRNVTHQIQVPFTLHQNAAGNSELTGHLSIKRLDYDIGLGQWKDTRWVGNQVTVNFDVSLKPSSSH